LNDEVIKLPWFIYFEDTKELHKIYEGTTPETLNMGIGHFEESPIINGNIALAGHNRGYISNPFEKLKNIKKGSKVIYKAMNKLYNYEIIEKEKIEEDDFSKIDRKGSFLTLITCIENEKKYRLCVTAKEI
jgi:sortase family protein